MKTKLIYTLLFICCLSLFASAKQLCTGCPKKGCPTKTSAVKKQPVKTKKVTTATIRPLNFYLFNI